MFRDIINRIRERGGFTPSNTGKSGSMQGGGISGIANRIREGLGRAAPNMESGGGFIPPNIGGGGMPAMGASPAPMGLQAFLGGPRATPPAPMNSTVPPPMRSGGIGGVAPRPAQGPMMRGIRGRGGMSMF